MKINGSSSLNRTEKLNKTINVLKTKPNYNKKPKNIFPDSTYVIPKNHASTNKNSANIPYNEILGDLMQYLENKIKPNLYQEINNYISTKLKIYKNPKLNKSNNNITKTYRSPGIKNKVQSNLNRLNLNTTTTTERKSLNKMIKNVCSLKLTNDLLCKRIGSIYKRKNQGKFINNYNNECMHSNTHKNNLEQISINSLDHKNIVNNMNEKFYHLDSNNSINNIHNDLISINLYKKLKPKTKKINIFKDNTNIEMKLRKKKITNERFKINLSQFKSKNDSKEKSKEKDFGIVNNNSSNNLSSKNNSNRYFNTNNFRQKLNNNITRNNTVNSSTHKRSKIGNVKKYNFNNKFMNEKLLYKLSLSLLNNINNSHNNIDEINDYHTVNLFESKTNRNYNKTKNDISESVLLNSKNKGKSFYKINHITNNARIGNTNFAKMLESKKTLYNNNNTANTKEKIKIIKNRWEKFGNKNINSGRKIGKKVKNSFIQNKKLDKNKFWKVVNKDKKFNDKCIHINSKEVNKIIKNVSKDEEDIKNEYMVQPNNNTFNDEELMKKIKNNLDDNLRVMLNFSYENFLSKESENDSTIEIP